jgi:hypothetical protein
LAFQSRVSAAPRHRRRPPLEILADQIGFCETDTVITLGDYVDRGPDSKGVINFGFFDHPPAHESGKTMICAIARGSAGKKFRKFSEILSIPSKGSPRLEKPPFRREYSARPDVASSP